MNSQFRFVAVWCVTFFAIAGTAADAAEQPPARTGQPQSAAEGDARDLPPLTPQAHRAASELNDTLPPDSEARLMLDGILQGSRLGPGEGWFRRATAKSRFGWQFVSDTFDASDDATVTLEEFHGREADFRRLDRDQDGTLTAADFDFSDHALTRTPGSMLFGMADRDSSGQITQEEFAALFASLDSGSQGFLSLDDLQDRLNPPAGNRRRSRAYPNRSTLVLGLKRQEIGSLQPGPDLNEKAPDFTLPLINRAETVTLSQQVGEQPVVLVFGNFTCGPFRSQAGNIHKLHARYKDRAKFFMIYVREAHPRDGWHMQSNRQAGIDISQPTTDAERRQIAELCHTRLNFAMPFLVDSIADEVGAKYSGMPSRLYVIDREGRVAYKSGRGPFGFKTAECEQSLILLLNQIEVRRAAADGATGGGE